MTQLAKAEDSRGKLARGINPIDAMVGGRIRLRRIQLGVERPALAATLGVSDKALHAFEAGRARVDAALLIEICRELQTRPQFFFDLQPS